MQLVHKALAYFDAVGYCFVEIYHMGDCEYGLKVYLNNIEDVSHLFQVDFGEKFDELRIKYIGDSNKFIV